MIRYVTLVICPRQQQVECVLCFSESVFLRIRWKETEMKNNEDMKKRAINLNDLIPY